MFKSLFSIIFNIQSQIEFLYHMIILCMPLRNSETIFRRSSDFLNFYQDYKRVPIFHIHLNIYFPLISTAILIGMKWYLILALICVTLMTNDVEHHSICLLAVCTSLQKCFFKSFTHFEIALLFFGIELYEFFIYYGY